MGGQQQPLNTTQVRAGNSRQDAVDLGHGIYMSRDVSNAYRVITREGDVLINTGIIYNAEENYRRLSAVSTNRIVKIIFTQGHEDHIGGWKKFRTPDTETIAQANFHHVRGYFQQLLPTLKRRSRHLWQRDLKKAVEEYIQPVVDTTFHDSYAFELGGRRFELYATPGGETVDSSVVWLPHERIVFIGNLVGPNFGHVPNLYTIRGDKIRYVQWFIDSVERVIALKPRMLMTGHDAIDGEQEIHDTLSRVRDAVIFIKEHTFQGMNEGKDLWTLMREIRLPSDLAIGQSHGKVPWLVRAIWEEHLGWFRFESSTELYDVPHGAVARDVVELAGADALVKRAREYLGRKQPLHALHLVEAVLETSPNERAALRAKLDATKQLLEQSGRENFSEIRWLEAEIIAVEARLSEA